MEGCSSAVGVRKGIWTREEDILLKTCIDKYGQGKWHLVPIRSGLNRCRKSCRLRWMNYLKPDIKRGDFAADEIDLILRLHRLLGNRWSLIAGRIPGRTANDVKNYWNTHLRKKQEKNKLMIKRDHEANEVIKYKVIRPRPRIFKNSPRHYKNDIIFLKTPNENHEPVSMTEDIDNWWKRLLDDDTVDNGITERSKDDISVPNLIGDEGFTFLGEEAGLSENIDKDNSSLLVKDHNKNFWTDLMMDIDLWDHTTIAHED